MDEKGQIYFNADDKEIPEEDAARYEAALEEASEQDVIALLREYEHRRAEFERRSREPTPLQREHVEKRTRFKEALRKEAQARWGKRSPEKE